jgi:hypothetical protein
MTRIVTSIYCLKRAPRKRKAQAAVITGPAVVTANSKRDRDRRLEDDAAYQHSRAGSGYRRPTGPRLSALLLIAVLLTAAGSESEGIPHADFPRHLTQRLL